VWARLRVRDRVKVGRRRVLRLMRENNLLSPYRGRRGNPNLHQGEIITQAPNVMWGTDGARVFTVEDGWVWLFVAVEHWNVKCMGWHVCNRGTRFAALEPIFQGLMTTVGSVAADAGRGLFLRMDHGTQYLSDHFQNQLKYWGIRPSFAFIEQPQTNGVAERFIRTLKEQVIYGRVFQNLQEVRKAVRRFVDTYNREWLVEKKGFLSPRQARVQWLAQHSIARAA
jgi:putative transposase